MQNCYKPRVRQLNFSIYLFNVDMLSTHFPVEHFGDSHLALEFEVSYSTLYTTVTAQPLPQHPQHLVGYVVVVGCHANVVQCGEESENGTGFELVVARLSSNQCNMST